MIGAMKYLCLGYVRENSLVNDETIYCIKRFALYIFWSESFQEDPPRLFPLDPFGGFRSVSSQKPR